MDTVTYSSFLAGVLLFKRDVANMEISMLQADFMNKTGVFFSEYDYDEEKMGDLYVYNQSGFHLIYDYDDIIAIDGKKNTVYGHLCNFTNDLVISYLRKYFYEFEQSIMNTGNFPKKNRG